MSKEDVNVYLRGLFPKLSEHLDDTTTYPWVILEKSRTALAVSNKTTLTGADILASRTPASRRWEAQTIFIGKGNILVMRSNL